MNFNSSFIAKSIRTALFLVPVSLLAACSDNETSPQPVEPPPPPPPVEVSLNGSGVKGPMALADVKLYAIDPSNDNFQGEIISSATTDSAAQIIGLTLTEPLAPPYLLEIKAVDGTFDITTNAFPVINQVLTIVTQEMLDSGDSLYATPLTTMAVTLAIKNADTVSFGGDADGNVTNQEILAALPIAAEQVKSTLGFGIGDDVNIYNTPPLINSATDTIEKQTSTTAYRSAIEAFSAVVYQMKELSGDSNSSTDDIIANLASDLSDGIIDGTSNGQNVEGYNSGALDVLQQDPATLPIPNDPNNRTVGDVKDIVLAETAQTGSETDTASFTESEEVIVLNPAEISADIDNDGVLNSQDKFPEDASADSDNDGDGIPDVAYVLDENSMRTAVINDARTDHDDDNDGVTDLDDAFPFDSTEFADTDSDGIGNNADDDDDGDSVLDTDDDFPLDSSKSSATDQDSDGWEVSQDPNDGDASVPGIAFVDTDGDGLADEGGNTPDEDDDGDGVKDINDAFPLNANETADLDGDGIGNNVDLDIDGDGIANKDDLFPHDASESTDLDGDGIGDNADADDDGDGLTDEEERILGTDPTMADTDGDGVFDGKDAAPLDPNERLDSDGDGIGNNTDNCPLIANAYQINNDDDKFGDACDLDDDNDGFADTEDDFPLDSTRHDANVEDTDGDGIFDDVDTDDDNDGVLDVNDAFPFDATESVDTDGDGIGNNVDTDDDGDGVVDATDAFPLDATESVDTDGDGIGNNTDTDDDGDGVADINDAFPLDATESVDTDGDSIGNNTDPDDDGDGIVDVNDAFPLDVTESVDTDGDSIGNNADTDDDGDGVADIADAFPLDATESIDTDGDGIGNNADTDDDGDGVADAIDTFPLDATESIDTDGDGIGNNADPDDDGDGVADIADAFPLDATESIDTDGDGIGNNADTDDDGDGVADATDTFPLDATESIDTDGDGIGNNADTDDDGDGVADVNDAFPLDATESVDTDGDGVGDNSDVFPEDANEWLDTDGDGIGDNADSDANDPKARFGGLADAFLAGPVALLELDGSEYSEYGYELIEYDELEGSTLFKHFLYNKSSRLFEETADDKQDNEFVLTPDGWQLSLEDYKITNLQVGGEVEFSTSQGVVVQVNGQAIASANNNIVDILAANKALYGEYEHSDEFWSAFVDQNAIFSDSAQVYQMSFTAKSNSYQIWNDQHCEGPELVGGLCNFAHLQNNHNIHPQGALSSLNELFVDHEWNGVDTNDLKSVWAGGRDSQNLRAEFIASDTTSGTINFYVTSWENDYSVRKLSIAGQWLRKTIHNEEILTFEIPADLIALLDFDIESRDTKRLFAVVNHFVREGSYEEVGDVDKEASLWVNQTAIDDITANFAIVDTDGDGVNDAEDHDDDNDGVDDKYDSHPKNADESIDTDGDGIGNNADTDDDGDGVVDSDDLAPLDNTIGVALTLTVDGLNSDYVRIFRDSPIEPNIQLGFLSGETIHFSADSSGYNSDLYGQQAFTWSLSENVLLITPTEQETEIQWMDLDKLIELNLISEGQANEYRHHYGDGSIEIETAEINRSWSLVEDGDIVDTFWLTISASYQVVNTEYRSVLFGSENAPAKIVSDNGTELEVESLNQLANLGFTNEQVVGVWALPLSIDGDSRFLADVLSFSSDGSGTAEVSTLTFTWQINVDNKLVVTIDNSDEVITYQLAEVFDVGVGIFAQHTSTDNLHSGYTFALKTTAADLTFNQQEQFLMSSFILTNADAYDEDGLIKREDYFGFKLHTDQSANRVFGNAPNEELTLENWYWLQDETKKITLSARYSDNNNYADCDLAVASCSEWRHRYWRPLHQEGDRLYVLEWSQYNENIWNNNTSEENWITMIPARVNFYQTYETVNTLADYDKDGIANEDDAFPYDNREWLDTDGDGIGNNTDTDDDNDGIVDWEDEYPLDESESMDTDGDGIGNNTDTDDDNDGVVDESDLAPLDDSVGMAIAFTSDNLASKYIQFTQGRLTDPTIRLGSTSGYTYEFNDLGTGVIGQRSGGDAYAWVLENNILSINYTEAIPSSDYPNVSRLAELGVISQESADNFISANSDYQIHVEITISSEQWQLLADEDDVDRFWVASTSSYRLVDDWEREQLLGNIEAGSVEIKGNTDALALTDNSSLAAISFIESDVVGTWALPLGFAPTHEDPNMRLVAEQATFNADNTGLGLIFNQSFTWLINEEGQLEVILDANNEHLVFTQYEQYGKGIGLLTTADFDGKKYSTYTLAVKSEAPITLDESMIDHFMMNSFTLTNPDAFDENNNVFAENVFGFRLETGGSVTRVFNGNFNPNNDRDGWDKWSWSTKDDGSIELIATVSEFEGAYTACDSTENSCNDRRRRHWQPLAKVGNRLYVLEWSDWNDNAYNYDGSPEQWRLFIPPRVQFYQVYALDFDHDGINDDDDLDDDNDGVADIDDAFPLNPYEWLDTDGDTIGNNEDQDDDNDGVNDWDDEFPLDGNDWADVDHDGIGDNADTDDDNDGVLDSDDLAPLNDEVGQAISFTADNLASHYIHIIRGKLNDPTLRLGRASGNQLDFSQANIGSSTNNADMFGFSWSIANDVLTLMLDESELSTNYLTLVELVKLGVVSQSVADSFINQFGFYAEDDIWIEVEIEKVSEAWHLLEDTVEVDKFWLTENSRYNIVNSDYRESLLGSIDADSVAVTSSGYMLNLTEQASLTALAFTPEDIVGQWALPIVLDPTNEDGRNRFVDDLATFNSDNTGITQIFAKGFTWEIDSEGVLVVTITETNGEIRYTRYENYTTGIGVHSLATLGEHSFSSYTMAVNVNGAPDITAFTDQFMMNSFTLTNPDAFDDEGNVHAQDYFGFRLETGGNVTRVLSGDLNINEYKDGWDRWSWQQENDGTITIKSNHHEYENSYVNCNAEEDSSCNRYRTRHWQPLQQVGDRLYVLEWEERNYNYYNFPSDEDWKMWIKPRVQFYQIHDLNVDYDGDGVIDAEDLDDDNDGVADLDDEFPLDSNEWLDTDGDGIGNNSDDDDDNDGVNDWDDEFPLDSNEWADVDHDGLGNNVDTDDDNDGVLDSDDLAPLNNEVGQAISFTADNLASHYIQIVRGKLSDPTIQLGKGSGNQLDFSQTNIGSNINNSGIFSFSWSIANDALTLTLDESEISTNHLTLVELVKLGVVSQSVADSFINQFGFYAEDDIWIEVEIEKVSEAWHLLEDTVEVDKFWLTDNSRYNIVNSNYRESLLGSIDADSVAVTSSGYMLNLTEQASLTALAFTPEDIVGQWALPIALDPTNEDGRNRFVDDLATFNSDNTGITQIFAEGFTWEIDSEGVLVVTITETNGEIRYTRYENYTTGIGVHASATLGEHSFSSYTMAVNVNGDPDITAFTDQFIMNSFTLTNPDAFDDEGNVYAQDYFGFRLETGGNVTRVSSGDLNINEHKDGWDRWSWQQEDNGTITLESTNHEYEGIYTNCDVAADSSCKLFRQRHWQPLQQVGDRLYVLEWEDRNYNAFSFPSDEDWKMWIKPRVQFYQIHDLDTDNDGELDATDWDDDNDGYSDQDDAFPFDPTKW